MTFRFYMHQTHLTASFLLPKGDLLYIGNRLQKKMFADFMSLGAFANIFL